MSQQFIHSLDAFVDAQLKQYGQMGIMEIVLEERMFNRVYHEISMSYHANGMPMPYCDYFIWNVDQGKIQVRKFGTKDKDFHHTGIENGLG